jgi:TonB-dependent SusC/RagA subfamily outer membrane receptor
MRHALAIVSSSLLLLACNSERLTHPTIAPAPEGSRVALGSSPAPLFVVDGRVLPAADSAGLPASVRDLDPASIESIEVLKGAKAARAYGAAGASGVVLITTKRKR